MSKRVLYDLKDMLCAELDEIGKKGEMSAGDLETVHKLTDTIKNIDKIVMLEDDGYSRDEDYSRDGDWSANMRGNYGRGSSYARQFLCSPRIALCAWPLQHGRWARFTDFPNGRYYARG